MKDQMCPECNRKIIEKTEICPYCGYKLKEKRDSFLERAKKNRGILLLILACVLLMIAFGKVNNNTYVSYKQHYKECMEEYADSIHSANTYTGTYLKSSYFYIASEYEAMAKQDNKRIWNYRIQAILFGIGGIASGLIGYGYIRKEKKDGSGKMS